MQKSSSGNPDKTAGHRLQQCILKRELDLPNRCIQESFAKTTLSETGAQKSKRKLILREEEFLLSCDQT